MYLYINVFITCLYRYKLSAKKKDCFYLKEEFNYNLTQIKFTITNNYSERKFFYFCAYFLVVVVNLEFFAFALESGTCAVTRSVVR